MSLWRQVRHGLRGLFRRPHADADLQAEIDHYLERATQAYLARGLGPEAARRAARLELGSPAAVREEVRSYGWENVVASVLADLRYALRALRRTPVFSSVAILVIALGSGAVTTIYSAMNAIVLRPLPGATDAGRLVGIERRRPDADEGIQASYDYYRYLERSAGSLEGVAVWSKAAFTLAAGGEGIAVYGNLVSGNYFSLLGVRPVLGRFFSAEEDRTPLAHPVLVVSHAFWAAKLGGDSAAVGRPVIVNGRPYTLIGVAPPAFHGVFTPLLVDAWVPLTMQPHLRPGRDLDQAVWLWTFGRLRKGVTFDQARTELASLTQRYIDLRTEPAAWAGYTAIRLTPMTGLPADARAMALSFIGLLLGASVLVLLIASVNVASMLSARAIARRREMAVRAALGAGRRRLVRQLLTEILVLFVAGAGGGILIAIQSTAALERFSIPAEVPMVLEVSPDGRVFGFAVAIALATGLVVGLVPALRATTADLNARLRDGGAGGRRPLIGRALIVGQLALSLVLLVSAGLFLRALDRGIRTDPGFDPTGVLVAAFNPESWGYSPDRGRAFYAALEERLAGLPGVTAAAFTGAIPLAFATSSGRVVLDGDDPDTDRPPGRPVELAHVTAEFFRAMRIPIEEGRPIGRQDDARAPRVAVVNRTLARRFWPEGGALGRTFTYLGERVTIVGVARDAKYSSLAETTPAFLYLPMAQRWQANQVMLVRTSGSAEALAPAIQREVLALDPLIPRPDVVPLREANGIVLLPQRIAAVVTGSLGAVGLILATVGLYGSIAYGVSRRTREIGLRVALGADRRDVLHLVLREGMGLAAVGVALGLGLAALASRLLGGLLFGVSPLDPATFGAMSLLFLGTAWLASYLPARGAAAADPMAALRVD